MKDWPPFVWLLITVIVIAPLLIVWGVIVGWYIVIPLIEWIKL
jgi:hypothetical protein